MNTVKTLWQTQHALIVTVLGLVVAPLATKFGIVVDPALLYSGIGLIAVYVAGHHYKEAAIAAAKIAAGIFDQLPTPKPVGESSINKVGKLALVLVLVGVAIPAPARAQPIFSFGPTLPLLEYRPGNPSPVNVAAGAGVQLSVTFPGVQKAIFGKSWDLLDLNFMAFGSKVSSAAGTDFGALSGAIGLCTLSSLFCLAPAHDIVTSNGTSGKFFWLFAVNFNFGLAPSAPPAGVESGPLGLPRGNTLYFGAP